MLRNLKPLELTDLQVCKMTHLCLQIWPQYKLDNHNHWPKFGTSNQNVLYLWTYATSSNRMASSPRFSPPSILSLPISNYAGPVSPPYLQAFLTFPPMNSFSVPPLSLLGPPQNAKPIPHSFSHNTDKPLQDPHIPHWFINDSSQKTLPCVAGYAIIQGNISSLSKHTLLEAQPLPLKTTSQSLLHFPRFSH